jgi:hypothetical protein
LYDVLLDLIRKTFDERFVDRVSTLFSQIGYYALFAAMGAGLILALVVGVKTDSVRFILMGFGAILAVSVLQYAAKEFLAALERLNKSTPARMASAAFLNCFALVNILGGVIALVGLGYVAIKARYWGLSLYGVVAFLVCEYVAILSLNPQALNISLAGQSSAGEEAVGVYTFLVKVWLRLVPIAFGAWTVIGTLLLTYAIVLSFGRTSEGQAMEYGFEGAYATITAALQPTAGYLLFVTFYFLLDIARAVLAVPGKLDVLAERAKEVKP